MIELEHFEQWFSWFYFLIYLVQSQKYCLTCIGGDAMFTFIDKGTMLALNHPDLERQLRL